MQQIHQLPGRIRVRSQELKVGAAEQESILQAVSSIGGVKAVTFNTVSGSLLVHHHPHISIAALLFKELKRLRLQSNVIGFPGQVSPQVWQRLQPPSKRFCNEGAFAKVAKSLAILAVEEFAIFAAKALVKKLLPI